MAREAAMKSISTSVSVKNGVPGKRRSRYALPARCGIAFDAAMFVALFFVGVPRHFVPMRLPKARLGEPSSSLSECASGLKT